jgi:lipoic acid synthetase
LDGKILTKSGLMLGLGESGREIRRVLSGLVESGCTVVTLGQYLQPSRQHLPVTRYVPPEEFDEWREYAMRIGFKQVMSGPFVRSSYRAAQLYNAMTKSAFHSLENPYKTRS